MDDVLNLGPGTGTGTGFPKNRAVRLCELAERTLEVQRVMDELDDASSGGVTIFVGRVRDHDLGRRVVGLEYVAHPSALQRLHEVCEQIVDDFGVTGVVAVHRVGHLDIGDVAVIIATTASHRGDAFDASRALIDRLKSTVPIWKHQTFVDGREEWVGSR